MDTLKSSLYGSFVNITCQRAENDLSWKVQRTSVLKLAYSVWTLAVSQPFLRKIRNVLVNSENQSLLLLLKLYDLKTVKYLNSILSKYVRRKSTSFSPNTARFAELSGQLSWLKTTFRHRTASSAPPSPFPVSPSKAYNRCCICCTVSCTACFICRSRWGWWIVCSATSLASPDKVNP